MIEQFLKDVENWEGKEIADQTRINLETASSPFMALFNAKRKNTINIFSQKFNSRKD